MAETLIQEASRSSKCTEKLFVLVLVGLAFFCIAASAFGLLIIFTFLCPGCSSRSSSSVVNIYWGATVLLFLLGVVTLALLVYYKRGQHSTASHAQVAISSIPAEDLEKSPAAILPYNRISQHQPIALSSSTHQTSLDLPDYFAVVKNIDEVYPSVNTEVWTEDVPETPPPCYEEAIEITTLTLLTAAVNQVDTHSSAQYAFTYETLDKSDEIFV